MGEMVSFKRKKGEKIEKIKIKGLPKSDLVKIVEEINLNSL